MKLLLALVLVALATAAVTTPAVAAEYRRCGTVPDLGPTGRDPADAKSIRALRVSCRRARRVARRWFREYGDPPVRFGHWTCRDRIGRDYHRVACKARGGKRVRFRLG